MSKIDDKQLDLTVTSGGTHQVINTPSGKIPAHAADAPIVSSKVVPFSAGKQITTPLQVVLPFAKIANPA
jgi:hypothetical protein